MDANKIAHEKIKFLHKLFDEYNENGLTTLSPVLLEVFHNLTIDTFRLIKFLHSCEPCPASKAYMVFCGKLLLRFSYLRHHGRIETDLETGDYFRDFFARYKLSQKETMH